MTMAANDTQGVDDLEPASGGYYMPLADLLTGVVFILVILLTAVTITSRPEYAAQLQIETERERLARELERLRAMERSYVQPRESARQALLIVLERVRADLAAAGMEVEIDRATGVLSLPETALFSAAGSAGAPRADAVRALAGALERRLACVADGAMPARPDCADVPSARIARTLIIVLAEGAAPSLIGSAAARGAALYGRAMEAAPSLALLRDRFGRPVIGHAGNSQGPERGLRIVFEMERPALPPANWLNEGQP